MKKPLGKLTKECLSKMSPEQRKKTIEEVVLKNLPKDFIKERLSKMSPARRAKIKKGGRELIECSRLINNAHKFQMGDRVMHDVNGVRGIVMGLKTKWDVLEGDCKTSEEYEPYYAVKMTSGPLRGSLMNEAEDSLVFISRPTCPIVSETPGALAAVNNAQQLLVETAKILLDLDREALIVVRDDNHADEQYVKVVYGIRSVGKHLQILVNP